MSTNGVHDRMGIGGISSPHAAVSTVLFRIGERFRVVVAGLVSYSFFGLAAAQGNATSSTKPGTLGNGNVIFVTATNDTTIIDDITWAFNFTAFRQTGHTIRRGNNEHCFGNLSLALGSIGPIVSASSNGASGALTLLPTAGALIGAPAKELWILYKLVPIAGVFSMMLSLGGNIVPNTAGEYELEGYNYGGIIATAGGRDLGDLDANLLSVKNVDPATFAQVVKARAENPLGSNKRTTVAIGVSCQAIGITVIFVCCWMTGVGSIIAWVCRGWAWMMAWYVALAASSLLENYALVPFSQQWTMRISRAPAGVEISEDAPMAFPPQPSGSKAEFTTTGGIPEPSDIEMTLLPETTQSERSEQSLIDAYRDFTPPLTRQRSSFIHNLERHGFNTTGRLYMNPNQPWASNHHSFLVIISVSGISRQRAFLRVVSKGLAVAVFAVGTAVFASATLLPIAIAGIDLALILAAGVFGRVASMWMVSEMMKDSPVIHRVVHSEVKAEQFMHELFKTEGLVIELLGHVFVNGRCVKRYHPWLNWSTIFGVLVSEYKTENLLGRR